MPDQNDRSEWLRYSGLGLELVGATAVLAAFGWWIDGRIGTAPWGVLIGALLGIVAGMTHLIRSAFRAMEKTSRGASEEAPRDHD